MPNKEINFHSLFEDLEHDPDYLVECAITEFTENVAKRMDELGINRAELARRLDTSAAYITKILQGNANFTLKSMVRISLALESSLTTHLQPEGAHSQWFDLFQRDREAVGRRAPSANLAEAMGHYRSVKLEPDSEVPSNDTVPAAA